MTPIQKMIKIAKAANADWGEIVPHKNGDGFYRLYPVPASPKAIERASIMRKHQDAHDPELMEAVWAELSVRRTECEEKCRGCREISERASARVDELLKARGM